jgi:3-deoxy-D-manno-octulosonic-acid transferase
LPRQIIYLVYRVLLTAAFPFLVLYVLYRGLRNSLYFRRLSERFGFLPHSFHRTVPAAIWLHAVSVGEVLSSVALIRGLRREHPGAPVFVSCSTLAGMRAAEDKLSGLADGSFYAPFDYCFAVRRILRTIRPLLVIVLETEIWPNLYQESKRAGCGLLVANGRISERAFPKYRRFRWFFQPVLQSRTKFWPRVRGTASASWHWALPRPGSMAGNLKYDFDPRLATIPEPIREFLDRRQAAQIWIAASTMPPALPSDPDEDDAVLAAFRKLDNGSRLLILAPRKPERFDVVAQKLAAAQIPFVRRTQLPCSATVNVLLLDSIGELSSLFSRAGAVFVGGTLASRGGHNILEPAFFGRPIVIGPHMENFAAIAEAFTAADAVRRIDRPEDLAPAIEALFADTAMGARGRVLAETQRGAAARVMEQAALLYDSAVPHAIPPGPLKPFLWLLAQFWRIGGQRRRRRQVREQQQLGSPVISIGNLGMGGSGKTPFVALLCRIVTSGGHSPAILTRGYGRSSPEKHTILAPGEMASVARTGDEAQILLRECKAAMGIGADRAASRETGGGTVSSRSIRSG